MMLMRPMTKRDIARVYEIEVQSFRSPWSKLSLLGSSATMWPITMWRRRRDG